ELERPSEREPVRRYAAVASGLYNAILNRCVEASRMCMNEIMTIDAQGGMGKPGTYNVVTREVGTRAPLGVGDGKVTRTYVGAICKPGDELDALVSSPSTPAPLSKSL